MGRERWSKRKTVEQCKNLDIFWLRQESCLSGFVKGEIYWKNSLGEVTNSIGIDISIKPENYVRVYYSWTSGGTGETENLDYKIRLETTTCYFGGERYWFVCPLIVNGVPCDRRVGKLYLPRKAKYFGCRHCYNLTYRSCRESNTLYSKFKRMSPGQLLRLSQSKDLKTSLLASKAALGIFDRFKKLS
jgi:hypothetical protein